MTVAGPSAYTVAISYLGDFCIVGGDSFITVMTQDSNMDSYT